MYYFKSHLFAKIGFLAVPMLVFMLMMENYFPKTYPAGFQSFIIAFEFAKTPEQIHQLFKGFTPETYRNINIGNYIDFGFMCSYILFLALFFEKAAKSFKKKWLLTGIPLSLMVLISDATENVYLIQITDMYSNVATDYELISVLNKLHFITWIKWGGLSIIFALVAFKSMGKTILEYFEVVVFIIPLLLAFPALSDNAIAISRFTFSIILAFFLLVLYCFFFKLNKFGLID
jgi:hypothetical protein